jgi:hypothetical protein
VSERAAQGGQRRTWQGLPGAHTFAVQLVPLRLQPLQVFGGLPHARVGLVLQLVNFCLQRSGHITVRLQQAIVRHFRLMRSEDDT